MAKISNYLKTKIIDSTLRGISFTPPENHYLALYTNSPTDADTGTEVFEGAYVRQPISFEADTLGATQNTSDITFPIASNLWGNVTHIGIRDASTGGNLLYHSEMLIPRTITPDTQLLFLAGEIDLTLT
jgi:hypothetical protein